MKLKQTKNIQVHTIPSPEYPFRHPQKKLPGTSMQNPNSLQLTKPKSHSKTSKKNAKTFKNEQNPVTL